MATLLSSRKKGRSFCYSNSRSKGTPVGKDKFSVNMRKKTIKLRVGVRQKGLKARSVVVVLIQWAARIGMSYPKLMRKEKKQDWSCLWKD